MDDGHRSVYTELFPLILQYRIPVTLFIYPSAISNAAYALTWDELREMQSSGLVEVQSHTYWHPDFRREKARLSPAACHSLVALQLNRSRQVLEERLGGRADLLAWPFGIVDPELEVAAREAGYLAAFGYCCGPVRAGTDRYAIPRIAVSNRDQGRLFAELLTGRSGGPTP